MRILLLLVLVVAACGRVFTGSHPPPSDATPPIDASPPDAPSPCPTEIVTQAQPSWLTQGPFEPAVDPAGDGARVWVSNSHVPAYATFAVPGQAGDRIVRLIVAVYGSGGAGGMQHLEVDYDPRSGGSQTVSRHDDDLGRPAQWGAIVFSIAPPIELEAGGTLVVRGAVTEANYYIGDTVTAVFQRPCTR